MTHDELLESYYKLVALIKHWITFHSRPIPYDTPNMELKAFKAMLAVVELHKPEEDDSFLVCSMCMDGDYTDGTHAYSLYPCETIQTIEKELQ